MGRTAPYIDGMREQMPQSLMDIGDRVSIEVHRSGRWIRKWGRVEHRVGLMLVLVRFDDGDFAVVSPVIEEIDYPCRNARLEADLRKAG